MSLHFAAARSPVHSPIARALARKALGRAANDNGGPVDAQASGAIIDSGMRAALGHFATHGLKAAELARQQAEAAHSTGERETYRWWLDICRALDRGLAAGLERSIAERDRRVP